MVARKTCVAAALLLSALLAAPAAWAWGKSNDEIRSEATASYNNGDYRAAYKEYRKLGKKGDTFSQYRVSYMELKGLGTKKDIVEAFAWAVLAAEAGHEDLEHYQDVVAALVPPDDRKEALSKAGYYLRRWGPEYHGQSGSEASGNCTGSKLAGPCGQGSGTGTQKHISWAAVKDSPDGLRNRVEELNQAIVENAPLAGSESSGH
ncbi:MAG: hypothetical protein PVG42_06215 [Lysobacterales bacterium]|jgi:TPR repeat protein